MSWVSAIGNIEISDEFNKNLLYENQNEIDKFILDDMGTYDLYKSKDNELIYWNYYSKKSYDR